jgi:hypothetical protein
MWFSGSRCHWCIQSVHIREDLVDMFSSGEHALVVTLVECSDGVHVAAAHGC